MPIAFRDIPLLFPNSSSVFASFPLTQMTYCVLATCLHFICSEDLWSISVAFNWIEIDLKSTLCVAKNLATVSEKCSSNHKHVIGSARKRGVSYMSRAVSALNYHWPISDGWIAASFWSTWIWWSPQRRRHNWNVFEMFSQTLEFVSFRRESRNFTSFSQNAVKRGGRRVNAIVNELKNHFNRH